jgi:sigma-E factor negative regulatory protein RseB
LSATTSFKRSSAWVVAAVLAVAAQTASASPEEAKQWLQRMTDALATRNYIGLFTHSTPAQSESMRIVHRVENGTSLERLVSLDGSGREIIRTREEVHAYLPDRRVVLVEPRSDDGSLLKALPGPDARLDEFYDLDVQKGNRLLGREVRVVDIKPHDRYRYGYRIWLDEKTAMPLRSVVGDGDGRPVEQISFTSLELMKHIPDSEVDATVDATGFQWIRTGRRLAALPPTPPTAGGWRPLHLPPGFRLVASRLQVLPGSPVPAQHLIFSDGMAAISIFIEPGAASGPTPPESSSMGSANAYSTSIKGHVVTAVGEVPADTVREVATSVVPMSMPTAPIAAPGAPDR